MSRLTTTFQNLQQHGQRALIPYITAGDPTPQLMLPLLRTLVKSGADIIELGVPFSDPVADGPVIQAAHERALKNGVTLDRVLEMINEFRREDTKTPIVLMGYLNPVEVMGYEVFIDKAKQAGIDGVLLVDLPLEEGEKFFDQLKTAAIDPIFLLAPNTSAARIQAICQKANGYLYYVSLKGVTGSASLDTEAVKEKITELRKFTKLPISVGFGIHDAKSAALLAPAADGLIIGSALIKCIAENANDHDKILLEVATFLQGVRAAINGELYYSPL